MIELRTINRLEILKFLLIAVLIVAVITTRKIFRDYKKYG